MIRTLLARSECGLASALITVALLLSAECRRTTITEMRTSTVTVIYSSDYVCAKLVNVTAACVFRRGRLIEEPEILTFDEEVEAYVDKVYADYQQFLTDRVISVEPTALAVMPFRAASSSPEEPEVIQSSISSIPRGRVDPALLPYGDTVSGSHEPRLYFSELRTLFNAIASFFGVNPIVTVTVTNVMTSTTTTGISSSFMVMGCTPSPFPYNVCPAKKRRNLS